jgi:hypothetical protein
VDTDVTAARSFDTTPPVPVNTPVTVREPVSTAAAVFVTAPLNVTGPVKVEPSVVPYTFNTGVATSAGLILSVSALTIPTHTNIAIAIPIIFLLFILFLLLFGLCCLFKRQSSRLVF